MAALSPLALRARVLHIFDGLRAGTARTNALERLSPAIQTELQPYLIGDADLQILASYLSSDSWTLITTYRIIMHANGQHVEIPWADIVTCMPTAFVERRVNMELKTTGNEFTLITKEGASYKFHTEPEQAFLGIWNVVRAMSSK